MNDIFDCGCDCINCDCNSVCWVSTVLLDLSDFDDDELN